MPTFPLSPANGPCLIKITKRKERGNICFLGKVKENNDPWEFLWVARRLQEGWAVRKRIALFYRPWGLFFSVEGAVYFLSRAGKPCSISDTVPLGGTLGRGGLFLGCRTACNWESPLENFLAVSVRGKMKEAVSSQAIWIHFAIMSWRERQPDWTQLRCCRADFPGRKEEEAGGKGEPCQYDGLCSCYCQMLIHLLVGLFLRVIFSWLQGPYFENIRQKKSIPIPGIKIKLQCTDINTQQKYKAVMTVSCTDSHQRLTSDGWQDGSVCGAQFWLYFLRDMKKVNECCGRELLDCRQQGNSPGPSLTVLGVLKSL